MAGNSIMITNFETRTDLMAGLANAVAEDLREALSSKDRVTLAVPGGTTPAPFFDLLCQEDLDWARVSIVLTDERFVPADHERSNSSLLSRHLLQNNAAAATLIPFYLMADEPEQVLKQISDGIEAVLPLDVCILGMGADMHTASLFPDSQELNDALNSSHTVHPVRPESQPEARLTLTGRVLSQAARKYVLIAGAEKLDALNRALTETDILVAPVRIVLADAQTDVFYAP